MITQYNGAVFRSESQNLIRLINKYGHSATALGRDNIIYSGMYRREPYSFMVKVEDNSDSILTDISVTINSKKKLPLDRKLIAMGLTSKLVDDKKLTLN